MNNVLDIFNDDAFSLASLTTYINNRDNVPGRAGELAFRGVTGGTTTRTIGIEQTGTQLSLIPTTPVGAPAPQETQDKRNLRALSIPQIKLEDTIGSQQLQGVRADGSPAALRTVQQIVNQQMNKMNLRHDLTLENLRLGALRGRVLDADGSELLNLFTFFNIAPPPVVDFTSVINGPGTEDGRIQSIRTRCHDVIRYTRRNIKAIWPTTAYVHAFCGDNFFDAVCEGIGEVYRNYEAAERRLGDNYAFGTFEFAGIIWENYQGTDDNSTVSVASDTARFFPVGVPGLYEEFNAPADFLDTVNQIGLPRYARIAPDNRFNRQVFLHTQQNVIPICTRPQVLLEGTFAADAPSEAPTEPATT